jgi:hypothetical protein
VNIVIPTLVVGILYKGERMEYLPEYFVQHLSVGLPLLIQPLLRNIALLDWNREEGNNHDIVHRWHLVDLRRQIAKCDMYRLLYHVARKIRELYSVGHEDQGNRCIPQSE